jgi:hypothetical protein
MSLIPPISYTPGKKISAASTNATVIKAAPGVIGYLCATNTNANPRFVKLYDKATAPTVGTDVPVATFLVPGNTSGSGTNVPLNGAGMNFLNGISFAITANVGDADATSIAASEVVLNYGWV